LSKETPILVTGAAGFIGFHTVRRLLASGIPVHGVDNLTGAADPLLQQDRWQNLAKMDGFQPFLLDLANSDSVSELFRKHQYRHVFHLAARVGVRDSVRRPEDYLQANLRAFLNLLEACRLSSIEHLVYASSSSVYGVREAGHFKESAAADEPVSFYAATKKANELMAHAWSQLHGLPVTGLRFFTVYGPWGRPDMAIYRFVRAILTGGKIPMYNHGVMRRDFTYVDDVVEVLFRCITAAPVRSQILNVGSGRPVELRELIATIEQCLGLTADVELLPMQLGDVPLTAANTDLIKETLNYVPSVPLKEGIRRFVNWFKDYHSDLLLPHAEDLSLRKASSLPLVNHAFDVSQ
jgi:UDP-glucuronate 4-epimerase